MICVPIKQGIYLRVSLCIYKDQISILIWDWIAGTEQRSLTHIDKPDSDGVGRYTGSKTEITQ